MNGTGPGRIRVEPVKREWADALSNSDAEFTRWSGVPVAAGWAGVSETLPIIIAAAHEGGPGHWGPHLFFGEDGASTGNGGWKGPPGGAAAELGYAVAPARQAGASPPPSCVNWSEVRG